MKDPYSEVGMYEKERQRRAELAELRALMFFIVDRPITPQTRSARRDIVRKEAPRWRPDKAFARLVGDPRAKN